jgi:hypothetical protein
MWDEIQDMPGEIFDISDETRDEMAAAWSCPSLEWILNDQTEEG